MSLKSRIRHSVIGLAALSAVCVMAVGQAGAAEPNAKLRALIAKANAEGELSVSWAQSTLGGAKGARLFTAGIKKLFGANVRVKYSPGPSMSRTANKIATEAAAGQPASTDVYIGPSFAAAVLVNRKLLVPTKWTEYLPGRITPDIVEIDGMAIRIATGLPGVTYNKTLLPGGKIPTNLSDFLKPEWKGKFASTPYAASFESISSTLQWGPEKAVAFIAKLSKQIGGLIRCGEGERIATGEYAALVMDCSGQQALMWKQKGAPTEQAILLDAAQKRYWYVGVPTNSANPNAATLYVLFAHTPEGQKIIWDTWRVDLDSYPGSQQAALVKKIEKQGGKFIDVTIPFWIGHPEMAKAKKRMVKLLRSTRKSKKRK